MIVDKTSISTKGYRKSIRARTFVVIFVIVTLGGGVFYAYAQGKSSEKNQQESKARHVSSIPTKTEPLRLEDFQSVITTAKSSVVEIKGEGCGGLISGTGFVVAPNLVATNAHAVAGISSPYVHDGNGDHGATTILFDPNLDFAIVRTAQLAGKPLSLDAPSSGVSLGGSHDNERTVMLGYPGGDNFKATIADIKSEYAAQMYDIYGEKLGAERDLFSLSTKIIPGNSGSPIVQQNGLVAGVVFGIDPSASHTGLALPAIEFSEMVQRAKNLTSPVDTRTCAAEGIR